MDLVWVIIGIILMIGGILGCLLPLLPGPPLSFAGLLILQLREEPPFTAKFLWIWFAVTIIITALDYIIPVYGTKRFGGTKYGVWGCTIGLVLGIFIPPWGLILGPFVGAFVGELMANSDTQNAWKAALGSFIGFLLGTLLKVIASLIMCYYFIKAVL
jgi:uncharacterized protein